MGKTVFALNVSEHVALGLPVLFFTLEQRNIDLVMRMLARTTLLNLRVLREGPVDDRVIQLTTEAAGDLADSRLFLVDQQGLRLREVSSIARAWTAKSKQRPGLLVIDYLQLVLPDDRHHSREREVASVSAGIKSLAKELNCPVLLVSQLSRKPEDRQGHEQAPRLADLRDSGSIEQDADVVIGIFRRWPVTKAQADKNHAQIEILKNRNGDLGKIELLWDGPRTTFRNRETNQGGQDREHAHTLIDHVENSDQVVHETM